MSLTASPLPATSTPPAVLQLRSSAGLYGADRMILALDRGLVRRGARSAVLSIRNYLLQAQPLHEAAVAGGHDASLLPCRGRIDMRTVAALQAELDVRGAAILHVHDYKSAFYGWLATRRRPVRLVATLHGWVETTPSLRLYNSLEMALLRRFDAMVAVSDVQRRHLLGAGVDATRVHRIDNGIEIAEAAPEAPHPGLRAELGLPVAGKVFAAVGRLSREKNIGQLLEAFQAVATADPRACLLVVGDGPERPALEAIAAAPPLAGRVAFAGVRHDVDALWPLVDVLVLPSLSEGMPLVVLEALANGVPVVGSAVGDVPRLLAGTAHGHVLPPGDLAALRVALLGALSRPFRRDAAGAAYVRARHSSDTMALGYLDLYHAMQEQHHARRSA